MAVVHRPGQGLAGCCLQQKADQVAERAPFSVSPLLESLVELPVSSERDPCGLSLQQIRSWLQRCSQARLGWVEGRHHPGKAGWSRGRLLTQRGPTPELRRLNAVQTLHWLPAGQMTAVLLAPSHKFYEGDISESSATRRLRADTQPKPLLSISPSKSLRQPKSQTGG
jgi:hypothetical protein